MHALSELLTIVIPVKNEEKNLPACLEHVREFRNVALVDSESNDQPRRTAWQTRRPFDMGRRERL